MNRILTCRCQLAGRSCEKWARNRMRLKTTQKKGFHGKTDLTTRIWRLTILLWIQFVSFLSSPRSLFFPFSPFLSLHLFLAPVRADGCYFHAPVFWSLADRLVSGESSLDDWISVRRSGATIDHAATWRHERFVQPSHRLRLALEQSDRPGRF